MAFAGILAALLGSFTVFSGRCHGLTDNNPEAIVPLPTVTNLVAVTGHHAQSMINVTWTPPVGDFEHVVVSCTHAEETDSKRLPANAKTSNFTGLVSETEYTVRVWTEKGDRASEKLEQTLMTESCSNLRTKTKCCAVECCLMITCQGEVSCVPEDHTGCEWAKNDCEESSHSPYAHDFPPQAEQTDADGASRFSLSSFFGGMLLMLVVLSILFFTCRFLKRREEARYGQF